jgi:hypothetical protein
MNEIKSKLPTNEYRDNWDRIFTQKKIPRLLTQPFPLRPWLDIQVSTPEDFELKDLRKLVYYLHTMCVDWKPEMGFVFMEPTQPTVSLHTILDRIQKEYDDPHNDFGDVGGCLEDIQRIAQAALGLPVDPETE